MRPRTVDRQKDRQGDRQAEMLHTVLTHAAEMHHLDYGLLYTLLYA